MTGEAITGCCKLDFSPPGHNFSFTDQVRWALFPVIYYRLSASGYTVECIDADSMGWEIKESLFEFIVKQSCQSLLCHVIRMGSPFPSHFYSNYIHISRDSR